MHRFNQTDRTDRLDEFAVFARDWSCPRCGVRTTVFNLCPECFYATWGRLSREIVGLKDYN